MARERGSKPPEWPSVEEQLTAARVVHGSALEQLIRDNQDFELLHPDEVDDGLPVPLWLRVHWRKQHPEEQPHADSPAARYPYPDVLDSVYEWMLLHQDLPRWYPPQQPSGAEGSTMSSGEEPAASGGAA
jgi:hypothetical protein